MSYEIECPVCDRKSPATATVCSHCGADLRMASFDDLEEVAVAIAAGKPSSPKPETKLSSAGQEPKPEPAKGEPQSEPEAPKRSPKPQEPSPQPKAEETSSQAKPKEEKKDEGKHGLGRIFGKKKK